MLHSVTIVFKLKLYLITINRQKSDNFLFLTGMNIFDKM